MLYNLNWLQQGKPFPPNREKDRILRYRQNAALFDGDHFVTSSYRYRNGTPETVLSVYEQCARRISRVIGNFEDVISFPVLINYQRLMTMKIADLICGEPPTVSGTTPEENKLLKEIRDYTKFDEKLYTAVIDISRYGDAVLRIYKDDFDRVTFTCWDPTEWFPIVSQDGTNTIIKHCLCWIENVAEDDDSVPDYRLHVQIHDVLKPGTYEHRVYKMDTHCGIIGKQLKKETKTVLTGLKSCAVCSLKSFSVSNTVYGYDDYMPIDSILSEILARIGQISVILDKHADPNITGPVSMLQVDPVTGEYRLKTGKFYAVSPGEEQPKYMVWEGQLDAAFKQLEFLINQLYIVSEMGSALLGDAASGSQAVSGTAMRFKMAGPLAKARRVANSLSLPVRELFATLSRGAAIDGESDITEIEYKKISVLWSDGLPDDPRENIEIAKLATGETKLMPLEEALMEYFNKSNEEALDWVDRLRVQAEEAAERLLKQQQGTVDPNKPGPQNGTGVNPTKKGSTTGLQNPAGQQNRNQDTNRSRQTAK